MSNYIPDKILHVITCPCPVDTSMLLKRRNNVAKTSFQPQNTPKYDDDKTFINDVETTCRRRQEDVFSTQIRRREDVLIWRTYNVANTYLLP